jgi:hypothetical protein
MWDHFDENTWDEDDADDFQKSSEESHNHPLFWTGKEILKLTRALVGSLDEARKTLYGRLMMESASVLCSKFSDAESTSDFIFKMENAVIMKVNARELNTMTYQLALEGTHAEEHLKLLRDAIRDFKSLFVEWIRGFDPNEKIRDGWGIFED